MSKLLNQLANHGKLADKQPSGVVDFISTITREINSVQHKEITPDVWNFLFVNWIDHLINSDS